MSKKDYYLEYVPIGERDRFLARLDQIALEQGNPVIWYLAVMWHESLLNPAAFNPDGGGGGLIGFMPGTAQMLGTSVSQLRAMSRLQQLEYVRKYYGRADHRFKDFEDFYLYTFYPEAIGKPPWYVIGSEQSMPYANRVARSNRVFDLDKDGLITLAEYKKYVRKKFPEIRASNILAKAKRIALIVIAVLLFVLIIFLLRQWIA